MPRVAKPTRPLTPDQQQLILANLHVARIVASNAARYRTKQRFDDCLASAQYGLCLAAQGFRPDGGAKFSTYARRVCEHAVKADARADKVIVVPSWLTKSRYQDHPLQQKARMANVDNVEIEELDQIEFG